MACDLSAWPPVGHRWRCARPTWSPGSLRDPTRAWRSRSSWSGPSGDDLAASLDQIGGQGVFVTEVEAAVADGRADAAVHSAKDLTSTMAAGLVLAAVPPRADPRDGLVGCALADLPPGALIATGSARRRAQLAYLRPDLSLLGDPGEHGAPRVPGRRRLGRRRGGGGGRHAAFGLVGPAHRHPQTRSTCCPRPGRERSPCSAVPTIRRPASSSPPSTIRTPTGPCGPSEPFWPAWAGVARPRSAPGRSTRPGSPAARARPGRQRGWARRDPACPATATTPSWPAPRWRMPCSSTGVDSGIEGFDEDAPDSPTMTVYLVGAGPGDPGLLTRRGAKLLSEADVVLFDRLVHHSVLALAPVSAELIDVGKRPDGPGSGPPGGDQPAPGRARAAQPDGGALEGRGPLRLRARRRGGRGAHAGRCALGGRSRSLLGVRGSRGSRHSGHPSGALVVGDGRDRDRGASTGTSLAKVEGTLVILMGMTNRADIADALQRGGKPASTPVGRDRARHDQGPGARSAPRSANWRDVTLGSPAVIVVGPVAALGGGLARRARPALRPHGGRHPVRAPGAATWSRPCSGRAPRPSRSR